VNYLDATALVMRYVPGPGGVWVEEQLRAPEPQYTSAISYAEVHAALARRFREGDLKRAAYRSARNEFERDWLAVQEVAVDQSTMSSVPLVVEQARLRGMDAIHLSAAVWLSRQFGRAPRFISSDLRLIDAARLFGFLVANPIEAENKVQ